MNLRSISDFSREEDMTFKQQFSPTHGQKDLHLGLSPNDVRKLFSSQRGSQSIKIASGTRSASEVRKDEDEVVAGYREYAMYQRIVSGRNHKGSGIQEGPKCPVQRLHDEAVGHASPGALETSLRLQQDYLKTRTQQQTLLPSAIRKTDVRMLNRHLVCFPNSKEDTDVEEEDDSDEGIFELDM